MIGSGAIRAAGRRRFSGAGYTAEAVDFDGSNDSMVVNSLGESDTKIVSYSFWARWNAFTTPSDMYLIGGGTNAGDRTTLLFRTGASGTLTIQAARSNGTTILQAGIGGKLTLNTWHHILVSLDLSNSSNRNVYIDDVSAAMAWNTYSNANIAYAQSEFTLFDLTGNNRWYDGDVAEMYINNTDYIDLSTEANRRKFITSDGKPVDLGSDGSTPTGTQPIIYLSGVASTWNAGTNAGSWGDFTMTGAVADSGNEPVELP